MSVECKYIRQARLPGVGARGQRALSAVSRSLLCEGDLARDVESRYLSGAGVRVEVGAASGLAGSCRGAEVTLAPARPAALDALSPGAREVAVGAWAALVQIQDILKDSG